MRSAFGPFLTVLAIVAVSISGGCNQTDSSDVDSRTPSGLVAGTWRAWLDSPGGELPFSLSIQQGQDGPQVAMINGEEVIPIPHVSRDGDDWIFNMRRYDSVLRARPSPGGDRLDGSWTVRKRGDRMATLGFHAVANDDSRFALHTLANEQQDVAGRWHVEFDSEEIPAVGIFNATTGNRIEGTFLTTTGDYRYLAGNYGGGALRLSAFDGAHAFLFHAQLQEDGTLQGEFWSSDKWYETWVAHRDDAAQLPNAFEQTTWTGDVELADILFEDLDGQAHALNDPMYAGRARIIKVFGTWCPNCNDATTYMMELYERYHDRGLSVLAVAFEHSEDPEINRRLVKRFVEHYGIEYPVLVAGFSDKNEASRLMPVLDRVRSYPTTIFLSGEDRVQAVYSGFSGPATGEEYDKMRQQFEQIIEELLAE